MKLLKHATLWLLTLTVSVCLGLPAKSSNKNESPHSTHKSTIVWQNQGLNHLLKPHEDRIKPDFRSLPELNRDNLAAELGVPDKIIDVSIKNYEDSLRNLSFSTLDASFLAVAATKANYKSPATYAKLPEPYSWLKVKTSETPLDSALISAAAQLAKAEFSAHLTNNNIRVSITGLSRNANSQISRSVPEPNLVDSAMLFANLAYHWDRMTPNELISILTDSFKKYKGKLLIIVAHHGQGSIGDSGSIAIDVGYGQQIGVRANVIEAAARDAGVSLFLLGCNTNESTALGTTGNISADAVAGGLLSLFSSKTRTLGDIYSKLARDSFELSIDLKFSAQRYLTVKPTETSVGLNNENTHGGPNYTSPEIIWGVPRVSSYIGAATAPPTPLNQGNYTDYFFEEINNTAGMNCSQEILWELNHSTQKLRRIELELRTQHLFEELSIPTHNAAHCKKIIADSLYPHKNKSQANLQRGHRRSNATSQSFNLFGIILAFILTAGSIKAFLAFRNRKYNIPPRPSALDGIHRSYIIY